VVKSAEPALEYASFCTLGWRSRNQGNNKPIELKALTIAGILPGNLQKI
jgi:hypothetical protein